MSAAPASAQPGRDAALPPVRRQSVARAALRCSPLARSQRRASDALRFPRHGCEGQRARRAGCPLCMEDLDITERNFWPCKCGYQICLFCYRHIKEDLNGLCPACRTPYDDANVKLVTPDPQE